MKITEPRTMRWLEDVARMKGRWMCKSVQKPQGRQLLGRRVKIKGK